MTEPSPPPTKKRAYHSPTRQRQAEETRSRMLAAARKLFLLHGYAGTTTEAIAEEAGVSPKTVVAVLGSKRDILAELLSPDAFGSRSQEILAQLRVAPDPYQRVRLVAQLVCQIYTTLSPEFELLRGATAVAPELGEVVQAVEERRWHLQERFILFLAECGRLRSDHTPAEATDEAWALTSFDLYRRLVLERGWSLEQYEQWLTQLLTQRLVTS